VTPDHDALVSFLPLRALSEAPNAMHARSHPMSESLPFWKAKTLGEMSEAEWESLCDGCGRCCLVKLEDEDDGRIYFTDIGCRLLDGATCRCRDYANRSARVDDCVGLTPKNLGELNWLPPTCAYRLLANGRDLYWWHPLVSGDPESVHAAGVSVQARVARDEDSLPEERLSEHIVSWPGKWPKGARKGPRAAKDAGKPSRGPAHDDKGTKARGRA
jgi:uncharacterized cysteine cluster protein YcgN (CxxCxxCC family)